MIDLRVLDSVVFDVRHNPMPAQPAVTVAKGRPNISRDQRWSDIGRLPSLKTIRESPSISEILFDCLFTALTLHQQYWVRLCGARCSVDGTRRLAGRPPPQHSISVAQKGGKFPRAKRSAKVFRVGLWTEFDLKCQWIRIDAEVEEEKQQAEDREVGLR